MKIAIYHPTTIVSPITSLSFDYVKGVSSINVKNTVQFDTTKFLVLGSFGDEQTELLQPQTITPPDTIALVNPTNFPHNADARVTLIDFDKIKMYRSTTGIQGTYTLFETLNVDVANDFTTFEDTLAQTTYYYKFTYYNSQTSFETIQSDAIAATGFVFYSLKTLIDRVLSLFGDSQSQFVFRDEVKDYLNEFYELAQHKLMVATKRFSIKTFQFTVQSTTEVYDLPSDFLMEKAIRVSQDGGQTFPGRAVMQQVDKLGDIWQSNVIYGYTIVNNQIELDPIPFNSSDIIKIYYIPTPINLINQTDTLASPFQNRSAMFVRYALAMCYLKDKKFDEEKEIRTDAMDKLNDYISFVKLLGNLHPQFVEILDNNVM